ASCSHVEMKWSSSRSGMEKLLRKVDDRTPGAAAHCSRACAAWPHAKRRAVAGARRGLRSRRHTPNLAAAQSMPPPSNPWRRPAAPDPFHPFRSDAVSNVLEGVHYHESILDTVGRTPLVRLRRLAKDLPCPVLAKMENFNPGGSVKDRIGLAMVEAA